MVEAANQNVQADTVGQEETKVQQPSEEDQTAENALRDNIKRKGQNSVSIDLPTKIHKRFYYKNSWIKLG